MLGSKATASCTRRAMQGSQLERWATATARSKGRTRDVSVTAAPFRKWKIDYQFLGKRVGRLVFGGHLTQNRAVLQAIWLLRGLSGKTPRSFQKSEALPRKGAPRSEK